MSVQLLSCCVKWELVEEEGELEREGLAYPLHHPGAVEECSLSLSLCCLGFNSAN